MIEFHRHLRRGEHISEALRHAELTLMKNPRSRRPFYWAPFIALGDDGPIGARYTGDTIARWFTPYSSPQR